MARFCEEEAAVSWGRQGFLAGGECDAAIESDAFESDAGFLAGSECDAAIESDALVDDGGETNNNKLG